MKYKLFISAFLIWVLGTGCEKCVQCSYNAPGYAPYLSGQYCSKKKKDRETFENTINEEAKLKGTSAECVDVD